MSRRRILTAEESGGVLQIGADLEVGEGEAVTVGREAELVIGAEPVDGRVSRSALEITATADGWVVRSLNRNGVVIHPWGLPAWMAQPVELLAGGRVALRVLGAKERRHWVLLEGDPAAGGHPTVRPGTVRTDLEVPARPLTAPQTQALESLFEDLLAWPPVVPGESRQLKQVARAAGVTVSAIQARLSEARDKARSLGLARDVPLTDPEYLYVLVRAGYLQPGQANSRFG